MNRDERDELEQYEYRLIERSRVGDHVVAGWMWATVFAIGIVGAVLSFEMRACEWAVFSEVLR